MPLRQVLGERLGVPVFVDNDATVAALAEAHDEQLRLVARNLVMITVGTGSAAGWCSTGGSTGARAAAPASSGTRSSGLDPATGMPSPERFPQPGSLEALASGHALDRLARRGRRRSRDSALGRLLAARQAGARVRTPSRPRTTATRWRSRARRRRWAERVGIGIANAINTFDPDEVVIGGGGARAGELLLEPARRIARGYVLPASSEGR